MSEPLRAAPAAASEPAPSSPARRVGVVLAALALVAIGSQAGPALERFQTWVAGLGPLGPIVFILGYAAATVAFAPGAILTLAAGPIFGVAFGALYVFVAATLGAALAFLAARHVVRSRIEHRVAADPRFAAIDRAIERDGRRIVFLLRLSPVFPFNLLNYALGLTRVRFADYCIASLGMIPGTVLYVYIGALGGQAAVAASGGGETELLTWTVRILGLAATVLVTVIVTRIARRALAEAHVTDGEAE
jgi:uncharacterized membrane protein YdjX (TVP38/TMEM64 family)